MNKEEIKKELEYLKRDIDILISEFLQRYEYGRAQFVLSQFSSIISGENYNLLQTEQSYLETRKMIKEILK